MENTKVMTRIRLLRRSTKASSFRSEHSKKAMTKQQQRCIYPVTIALVLFLFFINIETASGKIDYSDSNSSRQHRPRYLSEYHRHHYDHYRSGTYAMEYDYAPSSISDIWVCLACALGWMVWFVSVTHRSKHDVNTTDKTSIFDHEESKTVMGHVLQVTLGEDLDGAGIPVYHAIVDYVVESPTVDEEPLQVRKCFTTEKLLEEGFANVEVLFLVQDPTTSILFEDYIDDKNHHFRNTKDPGTVWWIGVYMVVAILIGSSFIGAAHAIQHLEEEQQQMGWISLVVGIVFLYPTALFIYLVLTRTSRLLGPLIDRPGVVIHGAVQRFDCSGACDAILNPSEIMNDIPTPIATAPSQVQNPSFRISKSYSRTGLTTIGGRNTPTPSITLAGQDTMTTAPKSPLFPNAGCGFGNYNIHMPATYSKGASGESSVSSMSSSDQTPTSQKQTIKKKQQQILSKANSTAAVADRTTTPPPGVISTTSTSAGVATADTQNTLIERIPDASSKLEKYEQGLTNAQDESLMLPI